jgi:hypothetical protein
MSRVSPATGSDDDQKTLSLSQPLA